MESTTHLTFSSFSFPCGLILILSAIPVCSLLFFNYRRRRRRNTSSKSSALKWYPIIGNLPQFLQNRNRLLDWITEILSASPKNTVEFRRIGRHGVCTANPSNVEHVLKTNFLNYRKDPMLNSILEDFLGRGIFNSDGEHWKVQRKTASFEFNTGTLRNFFVATVKAEIMTRFLPLLDNAADTNSVVDLQDVLEKDCLEYKPERWIDEKGAFQPASPFKYPVFHGGPRICLGKEMAYIQMKSIVVSVLERFEIDVVGKETLPEKKMSLTIRMMNGLPVIVKRRRVTCSYT